MIWPGNISEAWLYLVDRTSTRPEGKGVYAFGSANAIAVPLHIKQQIPWWREWKVAVRSAPKNIMQPAQYKMRALLMALNSARYRIWCLLPLTQVAAEGFLSTRRLCGGRLKSNSAGNEQDSEVIRTLTMPSLFGKKQSRPFLENFWIRWR